MVDELYLSRVCKEYTHKIYFPIIKVFCQNINNDKHKMAKGSSIIGVFKDKDTSSQLKRLIITQETPNKCSK